MCGKLRISEINGERKERNGEVRECGSGRKRRAIGVAIARTRGGRVEKPGACLIEERCISNRERRTGSRW